MDNEIKTVEIHGRLIDVLPDGQCWHQSRVDGIGRRWKRKQIKFNKGKRGYLVCGFMSNDGSRYYVCKHTIIALACIGPRPCGYQVDHIDGDKLNNDSGNIRYVTQRDNGRAYKTPRGGTTSKYKNVSWRSDRKKWRAYAINSRGSQVSLGHFTDERDAARAFNEFASDPANGYLPEALNVIEEQPA